jgi:hypothetical protein
VSSEVTSWRKAQPLRSYAVEPIGGRDRVKDIRTLLYSFPAPQRVANHGISGARDAIPAALRQNIRTLGPSSVDALAARDPDTAESIAKRMIRQYQEIVLSALECDDLSGGVGAAQPSRSSYRNPDRQRA